MHWTVEEVPWGNLFRTIVTTYLFFLLFAMPIAFLTDFESSDVYWLVVQGIVLVSFLLASIVVWSETVPWIGDPEPRAGEDAASS